MPPTATAPKELRPYLFHGVLLEHQDREEAVAECPFCGKEKMYVNTISGLWSCRVCGTGTEKGGGNAYTFLRQLWQRSKEVASDPRELARSRGLVNSDTPKEWGVVQSVLTKEWLVPGFNAEGKLCQLYRYTRLGSSNALLATPGLNHTIHYANYNAKKKEVYLCEGPWDGMALWEVLKHHKRGQIGALEYVKNESHSLLAKANVMAVPGCNVFSPSWAKLFAGKQVYLLFDSDHPKELPGGKKQPPAGYEGMKRVALELAACETPPQSIHFLEWGPDGFDPGQKSGWDLRDVLTGAGPDWGPRARALDALWDRVKPIPSGWVPNRSQKAEKNGELEVEPLPCSDWKELITSWKKALKWTEGLDRALSVMLASVLSTNIVGDQLWVKIIGPPACGKSVLCEALSASRKYVYAKSTIRGFHSGFQTDRDGKEDHSLIHQVRGKTLVTKDGDTLLQAPNIGQILSEARDLYDTVSRSHYRNKMSKDYQGIRMTWILCGTESLRALDSSELGERFLDCRVMEAIDDDLEEEIGWRVINRVRNQKVEVNNKDVDKLQDPKIQEASRLTAGYVAHLRENAEKLLGAVELGDEAAAKCVRLGKFVSFMRARPSKTQDEFDTRELSSRLISQHGRLALCLAAVLGKAEVDDDVMRRVTKVATDTARGSTSELVAELHKREQGLTISALSKLTGRTPVKTGDLLRFLSRIGAVECREQKSVAGVPGGVRWHMTPRLRKLWDEVFRKS